MCTVVADGPDEDTGETPETGAVDEPELAAVLGVEPTLVDVDEPDDAVPDADEPPLEPLRPDDSPDNGFEPELDDSPDNGFELDDSDELPLWPPPDPLAEPLAATVPVAWVRTMGVPAGVVSGSEASAVAASAAPPPATARLTGTRMLARRRRRTCGVAELWRRC